MALPEGDGEVPPHQDSFLPDEGTSIEGKIVRISGESHKVTVAKLADGGVRIEGAEGIRNGETLLLVLLGEPVIELSVRWVSGDQAGASVNR